jgi:hypothetical protein
MHISQTDLSSKGLKEVSAYDIASMAQLPISEDSEHPTLQGVTIGRPTKLAKMAEDIASVLRQTGEFLERGGYQSLGTFIIECAKRSHTDQGISGSKFIHQVYSPYCVIDEDCGGTSWISRYGIYSRRTSLHIQKSAIIMHGFV